MALFKLYKVKTVDNFWLIGVKGRLFDTKGYFLIDTGAQVSMINKLYFKSNMHAELQEVEVMGIASDTLKNIQVVKQVPIQLTRYQYVLKKALVIDISHITEKFKSNYTILGLIGNDFLFEHNISIQYGNMEMYQTDYCDILNDFSSNEIII